MECDTYCSFLLFYGLEVFQKAAKFGLQVFGLLCVLNFNVFLKIKSDDRKFLITVQRCITSYMLTHYAVNYNS